MNDMFDRSMDNWYDKANKHNDGRADRLEGVKFKLPSLPGFEYTLSDLESVLIGAWEGGSSYWVGKATVHHPTIPTYKEAKDVHYLCKSEWAFDAIEKGGSIDFISDEEDDPEKGTLTMDKLHKALDQWVMLRLSRGRADFLQDKILDVCQMDAYDDDAVLQMAIFDGEIIFG